jgi:drug/metabolite transporter (DMT)-like permease
MLATPPSADHGQQRARVHAALLSVQLLFGLWPVAGASLLQHMTGAALIGIRLALGAPLLVLLSGVYRERVPAWPDLARLAGLGALGVSINQLLFVGGLARSGPINATVAVLLVPPFATGAALLLGREKPGWQRLAGVGLALTGSAVLVGAERFDLTNIRLVGNAMLVGNTACYALYLVLARNTIAKLGSLRTVTWVMVLGAVESLPFTLGPTLAVDWLAMPDGALGSIVFVVLGPTVGAYFLNAWALSRVDSSLVASYVYAQPPIAALASWWLLGVLPTGRVMLAGVIIVAGLALAARGRGEPSSRCVGSTS